jgi:hypothetical protein
MIPLKIEPAKRFWVRSVALVVLAGLGLGCGKIGDPLPPIPRAPLRFGTIEIGQEGAEIVVRIGVSRPPRVSSPLQVDLYRLIDPLPGGGRPGRPIPPEEYAERATLLVSIQVTPLPVGNSTLTYRDALPLSPSPRSVEILYAARVISAAGASLDLSEYGRIVPFWDVALPPTDLSASQEETAIQIHWTAPQETILGRRSAGEERLPGLLGYHLYRRRAEEGSAWVKLNDALLPAPPFADRQFEFGTEYLYQVRAVSGPASQLPDRGDPGSTIESVGSRELRHQPLDTFPPSAPSGLTAASIKGIVSLFWPLNLEPDVDGYHLYRTESLDAPPDRWRRLTEDLLRKASYQDTQVTIGRVYYYRLTAVDRAGNESLPSPIAEETVQP